MSPRDQDFSTRLPSWARVTAKRRAHIVRVTELLARWAGELRLSRSERELWIDAGLHHDALKDAPERTLRKLAGDLPYATDVLHGPAAAAMLERQGERRQSLLIAVRYHTLGYVEWDRTGRALYMADFLEPGRKFSRTDRTFLAAQVKHDFDGVFTQVVQARLAWSLHEGHEIFPETIALWNSLR